LLFVAEVQGGGPSGNTALVGATMMYEILCPLAEAVARRKAGAG